MRYYEVKTYYTLAEMMEESPYDSGNNTLTQICTSLGISTTITTIEEELWERTFNKFWEEGVDFLREDETLQEYAYRFFVRFVNLYMDTKDYYETIIGIYNTHLANLMKDIEAETTNEVTFNDTPEAVGGVLTGDQYATTYTKTKSTSKSEMKTPIERFKDIQDSLRNVWKEWLNHFATLFLPLEEN